MFPFVFRYFMNKRKIDRCKDVVVIKLFRRRIDWVSFILFATRCILRGLLSNGCKMARMKVNT